MRCVHSVEHLICFQKLTESILPLMQINCMVCGEHNVGTKRFIAGKNVKGQHVHSVRWESEVEVNIHPFDQMTVVVQF